MKRPIDIYSRVERYKKFYSNKDKGSVIVITNYKDEGQPKEVDFRDFDFGKESEHRRYWDILVENQMNSLRRHEGLEDDWIPGIDLHYGFGAFGMVYCDTNLIFTENTSYMEHVLDDWNKIDTIAYSKDRFWSRIFIQAAKYLSEKGQNMFMVDVFPSPSPLDAANLVRGNDIFTDFYEYADELKRLLDYTTRALIENAKQIRKATNNPWGGTYVCNRWIPGGVFLVEDAADLCSPRIYAEFGMPYTQKVINEMGGAFIHHHSLGRQQYRNISSLSGLYVHEITSDPNCKRPAIDLDYILAEAGNTVIDLECTPEEVYTYMRHLKRGRFILSVGCESKDEARKLVEFVRENS